LRHSRARVAALPESIVIRRPPTVLASESFRCASRAELPHAPPELPDHAATINRRMRDTVILTISPSRYTLTASTRGFFGT
jgi:hypothetical protein